MLDIIYTGEFVVVAGISQKGKNRVREHGAVWNVFKVHDNGNVMLMSTDGDAYFRWVEAQDDPDFDLLRIVDPENLNGESR